jgi:cystinosin
MEPVCESGLGKTEDDDDKYQASIRSRSDSVGSESDDLPQKFVLYGAIIIVVFGVSMGFIVPSNLDESVEHRKTVEHVSGIIGWTYFMAWSISFYPQLYTNWQRKSVVGLSLDFELYNLIGFAFYSIFNVSFFCSSHVDAQYKHYHKGKSNAVQANDVVFAVHAFIITALTCVQCVVYDRGGQTLSRPCIYFAVFAIVTSGLYIVLIAAGVSGSFFTTLHWLYYLSYVKLVISVSKYIPQVYMNYSRKSTYGWVRA